MGYYSSLYGRLDIDPAIRAGVVNFRDHGLLTEDFDRRTVNATIGGGEEVPIELDYLVGAVPVDDSVKAYDLEDEVREFAAGIPDGHRIAGTIVRVGEDPGDVQRYIVDGPDVRTEKARLIWPDGSEVTF